MRFVAKSSLLVHIQRVHQDEITGNNLERSEGDAVNYYSSFEREPCVRDSTHVTEKLSKSKLIDYVLRNFNLFVFLQVLGTFIGTSIPSVHRKDGEAKKTR